MTRPPVAVGALAVGAVAAGAGGALGGLARWLLTLAFPVPVGAFPWTTLAVNVAGSALLAALPLLPAARRTPWVAAFLGTGVLGGFTTMSAASVETFALLDDGRLAAGAAYAVATVVAAVLAVALVGRLGPRTPEEER